MNALKILLSSLIVLSAVGITGNSLYAQNVPELMYFKFNESGGTATQNFASAPVGTNPAPVAGLTMGSSGQFGSALVGNGLTSTSNAVNTGWLTALGTGEWTISLWLNNFPATAATTFYFFGDAGGSAFRCFTGGVAGNNALLLRGTGLTDVPVTAIGSAPIVIHFVHEVSPANVVKVYRDGVLANTVAQTAPNLTGTGGFKVGGYSTSNSFSAGCLMDEFRMYNRALSESEVAATWNRELPVGPGGTFFDNFESYTVGQQLACQDSVKWTTWSNLPCNATEDPVISNAQAFSGTKSVVIVQNNDLVRRHADDTTGVHSISFKFYIASGKAGYFNTLGTAPPTANWAMQVYFDSAASGNNGRIFAGASTAGTFSYTHNTWHTAKVQANLDIDSGKFYVDGTLIRSWRWTAGTFGAGGPRRLAANNFFGATAWDQMYMDDYDYHKEVHDLGVQSLAKTFSTNDRPGAPNTTPSSEQSLTTSVNDVAGGGTISEDGTVAVPESPGITVYPLSGTSFTLADTVGFRAIVKNFGTEGETSYQLGWRIDAVNQTPINRGSIASGANDTVTFQWNQAVTGVHTLKAWTVLAGDGNALNDTATLAFSVGRVPGDTLYNFTIPNSHLILGVAKIPTNKLVITSGGQSNTLTTDNKFLVTTLRGILLDTTHFQINNTAGQGFGFRDLAWDGRWLLASDNAQVRRIDTATFTEIASPFNGPGTLQRGLAADGPNRIWKSNFTTDPIVLFDTTGATIKTLGVPSVAPYGVAIDKWTSRNRAFLWYAQPSTAGVIRLSKVDTATGAILQTFDYSTMFPATSSSGGLDIVNDHPEYPGSVVAFMVTQFGPGGAVTAIYLGQDSSTVGVEESGSGVPDAFALQQNYPNPFNPTTTLRYALPTSAKVTLSIHNVLGQRVATLHDAVESPGVHDVAWSGENAAGQHVSSGVYFYRMEATPVNGGAPFVSMKKMILLK